MDYEWDPRKDLFNQNKHGIGFDALQGFDWDSAVVLPDERHDYGERRWLATGFLDGHLHSVAFTIRGSKIRPISLRRASLKERRLYDEQG